MVGIVGRGWLLGIALIGLLASPPTLAESPVRAVATGKVVAVREGKLERLTKGTWQELKAGAEVSQGDLLRTDAKAVAVIALPRAGRFVVGPGAEVELGKDGPGFQANLARGDLWMGAELPTGRRASITTSLATAGVRGTKFSLVHGDGGNALCVCTCSGEVVATLGSGRQVAVPKASILVIKKGAKEPERAEPSQPVLDKSAPGFGICFQCHTAGQKGASRRGWE